MIIRYAYEDERVQKSFNYQQNTNLNTLIQNSDICTIGFSDEIIMGLDGNIKVILTDKEHPFAITNWVFSAKINIDPNYFAENETEVISALVDYINSLSKDYIKISNPELITSDVITAIANNKNIRRVHLGSRNQAYSLNKDVYLELKNAGIENIITDMVDEDLMENFDEIIDYNRHRKVIGNYTYAHLQGKTFPENQLTLRTKVKPEEMRYLKHIKEGITIKFDYYDYENIYEVIKTIQNNNQIMFYKFSIDEKKDQLTHFFISHEDEFKDYPITCNLRLDEDYDINEYLQYEKRLYELIKPAMNLSPFEKYLYAYRVTKRYKKYKENKNEPFEARSLYKILDGEYMVCVGYSVLLGDLLTKLGIESNEYGVTVDTTYDNYDASKQESSEDLSVSTAGHARRMVNLVDPKYGIDGIYVADPTWDNDLENDTYCFALLTPDEVISAKRYLLFDKYSASELFYVSSLEEFYSKINFMLNHEMLSTSNKEKEGFAQELKVIARILEIIKKLDISFFNYFLETYPDIKDNPDSNRLDVMNIVNEKKYSKETIQDIFLELGEYILNKVNKTINKEQYESALQVMYQECYSISENQAKELTEKAIEDTKNKMIHSFPKREMQYSDGHTEIYDNEVNKFDGENKNRKI